ncbi:MAG: hypothetical protein FWE32_02460 [Oscillospiraceae bacterium]|nr:hypothetical protein [Oscillospiraceae bacterium]
MRDKVIRAGAASAVVLAVACAFTSRAHSLGISGFVQLIMGVIVLIRSLSFLFAPPKTRDGIRDEDLRTYTGILGGLGTIIGLGLVVFVFELEVTAGLGRLGLVVTALLIAAVVVVDRFYKKRGADV